MDKPNEAAANYELERSARHDAGHTALPWKAKPSAVYESVYAEDGDLICFASMRPNAKANAAFIVRAVNAHDDLVIALQRLLSSDDGIAQASADDLLFAANDIEASPIIREQAAAVLQARAALFKAQGA